MIVHICLSLLQPHFAFSTVTNYKTRTGVFNYYVGIPMLSDDMVFVSDIMNYGDNYVGYQCYIYYFVFSFFYF